MLIAEAVKNSDAAVDYSQFDIDGNGILGPQELAILVVIPQPDGDGSSIQPLYAGRCLGTSRWRRPPANRLLRAILRCENGYPERPLDRRSLIA